VLKELQKLCDSVRPIPDELALALIRQDLGHDNLSDLFGEKGEEHGLQLVAAASLGQVYKARLRKTGEEVAIKVQRPGMRKNFSLDLFLLQQYGGMIDSFTSAFTMQKPFHRDLFDSYSKGSYSVSLSLLGGIVFVQQKVG
jgi:predicted unusual protein kinase regulating ubiquinone biosynthesis (AarF/ABC1/UbiB family)